MKVRVQSIDSFSGEGDTEDLDIEFTGEAVCQHYNREIAALGCPLAKLFHLEFWQVNHSGTIGTFTLKGPDHFMVGFVYTVFS